MNTVSKILLSLCPAVLMQSCFSDRTTDEALPAKEGRVAVSLALNVPSPGVSLATRALVSENDEYAVNTIDAFVFKADGASSAEILSEYASSSIIGATGNETLTKVYVTPDEVNMQRIVVIANAADLIGSVAGGIEEGVTTYTEFKELLALSPSGIEDRIAGYGIPMWGESDYVYITGNSLSQGASASVDMYRAMARLDVNVSSDARSEFVLQSVTLCNSRAGGMVAPSSLGAWQSGEITPTGSDATFPQITYYAEEGEEAVIERSVYAFETPAAASNTDTGGVCLVVGGSWRGNSTSYYRVDFYDDVNDRYLPLLRNFKYIAGIESVGGNGYATVEEALKAGFTNLSAVMHHVNESWSNSVVWDGRYWLSVNSPRIEFYRASSTAALTVATNYYGTDALSLEVTEGGDWITINSLTQITASPSNSADTFTFDIAVPENVGDELRSGTIKVVAGRLAQTVTVTQNNANQLSLTVGDIELHYPASTNDVRYLRIEWEPASVPCRIGLSDIASFSSVSFDGAVAEQTDASGAYSLQVRILADSNLDVFEENRKLLTVTAYDSNDPSAKTMAWNVTVRQFDYAIVVGSQQDTYHRGTTYNFNVRANTTWRVLSYSSGLELLSAGEGQADTQTGETLSFRVSSDISYEATDQSFTLVSTIDPDVTVTVGMYIRSVLPNCYIKLPGETGILPVLKVYYSWRYDSTLNSDISALPGVWGASLVWQDTQDLISNITLDDTGDVRTSTISYSVNPDATGNALIAFTIDGKIYWSWHIWVLETKPEEGYNAANGVTVMDRYLGAMHAVPVTDMTDVYGLYYQHGRKDPFPGPGYLPTGFTAQDARSRIIYDANNVELDEGDETAAGVKRVEVAELSNLANAIANPLTYYYGSAAQNSVSPVQHDWYTSGINEAHRMGLWGPGAKTNYDPCPDGWKVPDLDEFIFQNEVYRNELETGDYISFSDIGFYAAQGMRNHTNGAIASRSTLRLWFTNDATWGRSDYMLVNPTLLLTTVSQNAMGTPVRCVKVH